MSHEKLRILAETTLDGFPDLSVERFIEDAVEEWDTLLGELRVLYFAPPLDLPPQCYLDHKLVSKGVKDLLEKYDGRNK